MKLARRRSLYHKVPPPCDLSDDLSVIQRTNIIADYFVYLILTCLGLLVSNLNWMTLDPRGGRYRLPTSRFKKNDMVKFAVTKHINYTYKFHYSNTFLIQQYDIGYFLLPRF